MSSRHPIGGRGQRKIAKPVSRSVRAGLHFPVGRVTRYLRKGRYSTRISGAAPIYLTAVIEYLAAEMLELAGQRAREAKRKRITPRDLLLAIRNDRELKELTHKVTIPGGGGVQPHIQKKTQQMPRIRSKEEKLFRDAIANVVGDDLEEIKTDPSSQFHSSSRDKIAYYKAFCGLAPMPAGPIPEGLRLDAFFRPASGPTGLALVPEAQVREGLPADIITIDMAQEIKQAPNEHRWTGLLLLDWAYFSPCKSLQEAQCQLGQILTAGCGWQLGHHLDPKEQGNNTANTAILRAIHGKRPFQARALLLYPDFNVDGYTLMCLARGCYACDQEILRLVLCTAKEEVLTQPRVVPGRHTRPSIPMEAAQHALSLYPDPPQESIQFILTMLEQRAPEALLTSLDSIPTQVKAQIHSAVEKARARLQ